MLIRKVRTAWRLLWSAPETLVQAIVRLDKFNVFSERAGRIPIPDPTPGISIQPLTDEQMRSLPEGWEQQTERYYRYGFHAAYGVYVQTTLAHINWLITAEQDARRLDRVLKLRPGEAEIAHGYTLPEFRRRGLQTLTIRALGNIAAGGGVHTLYSITVAGNEASERGIMSAGLAPCARAYRLRFGSGRLRFDIVIRGHRMPWRLLLQSAGRNAVPYSNGSRGAVSN